MDNLRICRIEERYVNFLHSRDHKVQYNKGMRRPYVGIVLYVGQFQYFVPMESPKPNHAKIKAGKHILKMDGGRLGLLGFNNMIPVRQEALISFDIQQEPDARYRELLLHQLRYCNRNKADIYDRANRTYYNVVNKKQKFLVDISCDFKKLEQAYSVYNPNQAARNKKEN